MKPLFDVTITHIKEVHELPHKWTAERYTQLLHDLDFFDTDGLVEDELLEMAIMALQDVEDSDDAAQAVLELALGNLASRGLSQQLVHELQEERAWEEHADMTRHAQIFVAAILLNRTFPALYPTPDIAKLTLNIVPRDGASKALLKGQLTAPFLVRLLACGMDDHSLLNRLFDEQIAGNYFPEAKSIIWLIEPTAQDSAEDHAGVILDIYAPWNWIAPLKSVKHFEASAHPDLSKE